MLWINRSLSLTRVQIRSLSLTRVRGAPDSISKKKLAAPESHLLVSSSLDKTLRIWDLRKSWTPQPFVVKGHTDGVSGFSIWGKDVITISRNNIGIFSLSKSQDEEEQHQQQRIIPQKLYMAEKGGRVRSDLSTICVLPFSRLFIVGAHDGYLRICC